MKKIFLLFTLLLCINTSGFAQGIDARAMSNAHAEWDDEATDPDVLEFALITDTHRYGPSADLRVSKDNIEAFVEYCNQHKELQFALYGGDFMNAYETNHSQALWCLTQARADFEKLQIPFYTTKGNHDCNGKQWKDNRPDNTQIITDEEYYQLFSPLSDSNPLRHPEGVVVDAENPHGNYYYRDFEQQRFRLIMLNNYDRDSLEYYGYHGQQMKWLAEVALDFSQKKDPSKWCFILVGHAFSINHARNAITRLLHAYVRGQDFSDTDFGVHYEGHYSRGQRAKMVATFGGHFHEDIYWNWDGYNMLSFSRGFATGGEIYTDDRFCFDHFVLNTRTQTLEERRIGRGHTRRLYTYEEPQQLDPVESFPEADGLGAFTQGGKGGRIVHVTNLNDRGKGSLRWAVGLKGQRFIVFDVNGTIDLKTPLVIDHDSITIAGQTSARDGITLAGASLQINASEVVIRYLRTSSQITDGDFGKKGLILDHITAQCTMGTGIAIMRTEDVTVQRCLFNGTPGNESPALVAGGFKASYYNNRFSDCINAIQIPNREGCNRWVHIVRNVFENWRDHAIYGGGQQGEASIDGNYFLPGEQTRSFKILDVAEDGTGRYYVSTNEMKGFEKYNRRNAQLVNDRSGVPYSPSSADTLDRHKMPPVQRPSQIGFANSCLVIAAFHNKPIFKNPSKQDIYRRLLREAGSGYRPQRVVRDSLYMGDIEGYSQRLVSPDRTIVVFFENDVHCNIDVYPYLAGLREQVEADTAWVAITSSGDFLQGGLAGAISQGQAIADIMQCIKYDAITLGNHEFDYLLSRTRKLLNDIGAPVVSANIRDVAHDTLVFAPYVIQQYGRRRIAYVGVTTPTVEETNITSLREGSAQHTLYDLSSKDLTRRVQRAVDKAKAEGADYVILLSHLGETNASGYNSHRLIADTHGIDAVLDGHTHSFVPSLHIKNSEGRPVLLAQTGSGFAHIGKLVIDPDGLLYTEMIDPKKLMFRDPVTAHMVKIAHEEFIDKASQPFGQSLVDMQRFSELQQPELDTLTIYAGDLVTDAMRQQTHADVAWLNYGSIRKTLPRGPLSRGNIIELLPYDNHLCTINLTGTQIMRIADILMRDFDGQHRVLNPVSGMRIFVNEMNNDYKVARIEILDDKTGQYTPLDPRRTYTAVTTDYCLATETRLQLITRRCKVSQTHLLYSDALLHYIQDYLNGVVDHMSVKETQRVRF